LDGMPFPFATEVSFPLKGKELPTSRSAVPEPPLSSQATPVKMTEQCYSADLGRISSRTGIVKPAIAGRMSTPVAPNAEGEKVERPGSGSGARPLKALYLLR